MRVYLQQPPSGNESPRYVQLSLLPDLLGGLRRISRRAMSAPSSGSSKVHAVEQAEIIDTAFAPTD